MTKIAAIWSNGKSLDDVAKLVREAKETIAASERHRNESASPLRIPGHL
jgi:hypothetical protein